MENLTENYSPGDSFLGSSEEFLSNVKERDKDICEHLLEKKKVSNFQKVLLITKNTHLKLMILVILFV